MADRVSAIAMSPGEYALLRRCQALAFALGVPSTQRAVLARALRSTLVGLTREAKRANIDIADVLANVRPPKVPRAAHEKRAHLRACPPPAAPRVRID